MRLPITAPAFGVIVSLLAAALPVRAEWGTLAEMHHYHECFGLDPKAKPDFAVTMLSATAPGNVFHEAHSRSSRSSWRTCATSHSRSPAAWTSFATPSPRSPATSGIPTWSAGRAIALRRSTWTWGRSNGRTSPSLRGRRRRKADTDWLWTWGGMAGLI